MKKLLALFLASAMLLSLNVPSFAAETHEITSDVVQLEVADQEGKAATISGFMKEGIPVHYVDVVEYMNKVYDSKNVFSLTSEEKGVYKISNAKGDMIVDTAKDTLHSDRVEQFLYNDQKMDPTNTTEYVYEHIIATEYRTDPSALDIDLSSYGIDIIEEDGRVYFPLTTAADLTGVSYTNTVYCGSITFSV